MLDGLLNWLADLAASALGGLPDWSLSPGTFPFLQQLSEVNYFVNLVPAFAVTIAALALGPVFLLVTIGLWGYGMIRGGGNRA